MASIVRVGQSKFVTTQIDEDSNERIMNCIQTLSELDDQDHRPAFKEVFLDDTRKAFEKMLNAQEVRFTSWCFEGWQCNSSDTCWFIETHSRKEGGRKQESCRYASWRFAYVPSILKEGSRWHDWCTYGSLFFPRAFIERFIRPVWWGCRTRDWCYGNAGGFHVQPESYYPIDGYVANLIFI